MANSLLSGLAGALTVTVLNEVFRRTVPNAPRLDVLGMRSIAKTSRYFGADAPEHLFATAMAGDLVMATMSAVGQQFSETPRTDEEITAYAGALADMLCAYLSTFILSPL